jgi:uncharacterized RDD family membrane protein YckC/Tfp pilus assembly protein PilE
MHEPFWHYTDAQGAEHGPVPAEAVRGAITDGRIGPSSQFWREGLPGWIDLASASVELGVATAPPRPPDPYAAPRSATTAPGIGPDGDVVYAGFLRRFAAWFLDGLVLVAPLMVVMFILGLGVAASGGGGEGVNGLVGLAYLAWFAIRGVYFAAMHSSSWQASLGKRALGIKVTDDRGERLGFAQALGRWFAAALSYLTFYIGFLIAGLTDRKRALHDMVAGTLVVDRWAYTDHPERQQREASGCLIAGVIGLFLMLFVIPILAAISISQYQDYTMRSQVSEGVALADGVKTAVAEYYANNERFPADNAAAGLAAPDGIAGIYVRRTTVHPDGRIEAEYSAQAPQKANASLEGARLVFTPNANGGGIQWQCHSDTLRQKWCPSTCSCQ